MIEIKAVGGDRSEREISKKAVSWSLKELGLSRLRMLSIHIEIGELNDCCGCCEEVEKRSFIIEVDNTQCFKDFIMTLMHEMVHVKQYVRNRWVGDGEREAWSLQGAMADKFLDNRKEIKS